MLIEPSFVIFVAGPLYLEGKEPTQIHFDSRPAASLWLEETLELLTLIPRVAVLGGIILTGYLGGAIATHLRLGEPVYMHVVIGLFIWGGLYLREPRLRQIIPLRK